MQRLHNLSARKENTYITGKSVGGLFRPFKAYFHQNVPETYRYTFQFYGGQVEQNFNSFEFSHYFVLDETEENDLNSIKTDRRKNLTEKAFKILNIDWITKCLQEKRLVEENQYIF